MKILLDTDIGSDIDDAVCLAYLLSHPGCELLGITTVTGQADDRARIAASICDAAGRRVPIFPGAETPLAGEQRQPVARQAAALPDAYRGLAFPAGEAVPFLRETVRRHPGEVVLLAIGPLTNVALLFRADPAIPALLRGLVLMCGAFDEAGPDARVEWNASCDPQAAAVVYQAAVDLHRSIGINVTERATLAAGEARSRFARPILRAVIPFAEVWFESAPSVTFHDPLAAATIFDPTICRFERGDVVVEPVEGRLAGRTRLERSAERGRHEVAVDLDAERFFRHFFAVFGG